MAKDGTNRGGARPGAGRKPKALIEKSSEGKSAEVLMQPAELEKENLFLKKAAAFFAKEID